MLDDKSAVFAFRGVVFLAMVLLLVHSRRLEESFQLVPFALAAFYLLTSFVLWRSPNPRLQSSSAQALAYLWDVGVVSSLMYCSEGFDNELYLMYFLIMFMSGLMSQVRQSFLIGSVSSLVYAALWSSGKVGEGAAADEPPAALRLFLRRRLLHGRDGGEGPRRREERSAAWSSVSRSAASPTAAGDPARRGDRRGRWIPSSSRRSAPSTR